jgi:ketosteroid isomerase-like protein
MTRFLLSALVALLIASPAAARSARADVEALIAADRAFSAAAAGAPSAADGLAAMLDAEVVMPVPGSGHSVGRDAVTAALRANPGLREGRAAWTPIRGGISADGTQGFTFGYLTLSGGDPARRNRKYLSYWVRRPAGWRVAAYRQIVRPEGAVPLFMLAPSLPAFAARPGARARARAPARIEAQRRSLYAAEQAFSERAQRVGLRAAFREYGADDAINMAAGAGFTIGRDAISQAVAPAAATSPVRWSTERSFVAASGDLGVSIGTIHANAPAADDRPSSFPFFTIWRRDRPGGPWRYVAE